MSRRLLPWAQLNAVRGELDRLIDLLQAAPATPVAWQPAVDVLEHADGLVIQLELPGVGAGDVTVELEGRCLRVRGVKRRGESEPPPQRYHLMERFVGAFAAEVELERPVDPRRAEARLQGGLLTVRLPLLSERRNRAFAIPVEEATTDE